MIEKKNEKRNFLGLEQFRTEILNGSVSKAHLYNCVKRGLIPSISIGGRLLIPATYADEIMSKIGEKI
jgi:hypothetical protein